MSRPDLIRSPADIAMSRAAGALAADVLRMIAPHVQPGVTTEQLDRLCHDHIVRVQGAIPANVGYSGYTKTVCTSVNHAICHGIPRPDEVLKAGDIINIDVALLKDGWFGDTSRTYFVGEPAPLARRLVRTTYEALCAGIRAVRPGATLGNVGHAIQTVAHRERFSVVREYCGHGTGLRLEEGMVFTIEPMINAGKAETKELADGWTVVTRDKSLSAQWEHMVAVTATGFDVLTPWPDGLGDYPAIG